jgi:Predicted redox protein, regulator of disulfide bond formation
MKTLYTAVVTSAGGRDGHITSSDGVLDFDVRKPDFNVFAIASKRSDEAIQSKDLKMDCFVASLTRNDDHSRLLRHPQLE